MRRVKARGTGVQLPSPPPISFLKQKGNYRWKQFSAQRSANCFQKLRLRYCFQAYMYQRRFVLVSKLLPAFSAVGDHWLAAKTKGGPQSPFVVFETFSTLQ